VTRAECFNPQPIFSKSDQSEYFVEAFCCYHPGLCLDWPVSARHYKERDQRLCMTSVGQNAESRFQLLEMDMGLHELTEKWRQT